MVDDYVGIVRAHDAYRGNGTAEPRFYPGSPRIAKALARPQDRIELWEMHPEECESLRDEFLGERRVSVHHADGYGALRACLPPKERRALVLIDPPFEAPGEWAERLPGAGRGRAPVSRGGLHGLVSAIRAGPGRGLLR